MLNYVFKYDKKTNEFTCFHTTYEDSYKENIVYALKYLEDQQFTQISIINNILVLESLSLTVVIYHYDKFKEQYPSFLNKYKLILDRKEFKINKIKKTNKKIIALALSLAISSLPSSNYTSEDVDTVSIEEEQSFELPTIICTEDKEVINVSTVDNIITPVLEEEENVVEYNNIPEVSIDFNYSKDKEKLESAYRFYDDITEIANCYGIDPNFMFTILCTETGALSENYMQVMYKYNVGCKYTAYNFEKERYETVKFANNNYEVSDPENGYIIVDENDLNNTMTNFTVAAIMIQYAFNKYNNNIMAAYLGYNGGGNFDNAMTLYSNRINRSVDDIMNDTENINWIYNFNSSYILMSLGFNQYDDDNVFTFYKLNENNEKEEVSIRINKK